MGLADRINSAVKWDAPSVDMQDTLRSAITKMAHGVASVLVVKIRTPRRGRP